MGDIKFFHQIVIRFSLRVESWELKVNGVLSEDLRNRWFAYRVKIFMLTVLPSLINQLIKPNRLVLLLDTEDSPLWLNDFCPYLNNIPFEIVPVFKGWDFSAELRRLSMDIPTEYSHVNHIRMDSDDLLSTNFIFKNEKLLTEFGPCKYILFPVGLRFDKNSWQRLDYTDNPFLTYCVEKKDFHNVLSINHEKVREFPCFVADDVSYMWAQYVHGFNVSNKFRDLQIYDGFRSYKLESCESLNYAAFGLSSDTCNELFNVEGYL